MKGKKIRKEEELPDVCAVCRGTHWLGEDFDSLKCQTCDQVVHKNCYFPDHKDKDKAKFRCDPCKKRSGKGRERESRYLCSLCGQGEGMLKDVSNQEWMHVLCALTSPRTHLASYSSLSFAVEGSGPKHMNKQKKCSYCKTDRSEAIQCCIQGCKVYIHLTCVIDYSGVSKSDSYGAITTTGMLDKNEGSLLSFLAGQKTYPGLFATFSPKNVRKSANYLVCDTHNSDGSFLWCPCGSVKQEEEIECESCKRWYHQNCLKDPNKKVCKGCRENDIFTKNLKLPELIASAVKVEKGTSLDKQSIRFLDHLCFKLSQSMEKSIEAKKNIFQVQRYFLRQHLDRLSHHDLEDEKTATEVIQILHYLLRRQFKKEHEIMPQNLEEMLNELSGKGTKFEWSHQKVEKTEKKYKQFISSKLKKFKKDSIREIRNKLLQFNKHRDALLHGEELSNEVHAVVSAIDNSEQWEAMFGSVEVKDATHIFHFLQGTGASKEQVLDILKGIKALLLASKEEAIDESVFESIVLKKRDWLSQEKAKQLKAIHTSITKGIKQKKMFESKKDILTAIENEFQKCKPYDKMKIRNKASQQNIIIPKSSPMYSISNDAIEVEICKRSFMKKFNPPDPAELGASIMALTSLLGFDEKVGALSRSERKMYDELLLKYTFYHSLITYVVNSKRQEMQMPPFLNLFQCFTGFQGDNQNKPKSQEKLEEKLRETLENWPNTFHGIEIALNLLTKTAKKKVNWTEGQRQSLRVFFSVMIQKLQKLVEDELFTMKTHMLQNIKVISEHLQLSQNCSTLLESCRIYENWKFQFEKNFKDFEQALEDKERSAVLLDVVDKMIREAQYYNKRIDFGSEIKKLKVMKTWARFSEKFLVSGNLSTITAMQNCKNLMEKIHYPKNSVRREIERLDEQGRSLNRRINRFLQKHKIADMQPFEQLRYVQNKMTLKEANELRRDLECCDLDVQIELGELKEQILNAESLPDNIERCCNTSKHSSQISQLKRQIIESPFLACSIAQFQTLLRKYYGLKCQQFTEPTTKKEYFRLLNSGGVHATQLFNRTTHLFNTYKQIQIAQRQALQARPRPDHLLNDIRKLRHDLIPDPVELSRIQRFFGTANRYRSQFIQLKDERANIEKFDHLASDITRCPVNCHDILGEIMRMKRQLQEVTQKARPYIPGYVDSQTIIYESPYTLNMLARYQKIGMRSDVMNKFQNAVGKFRQMAELARNVSFDNYKPFSVICNMVPELWLNDDFYNHRYSAFERIIQPYLDSIEPLIEVGMALLAEGGYLIKRPQVADKILPLISKVNAKLYNWEQIQLQPNQQGDEYDSEEFEDDDLEEGEGEGDQDDEDEECDEQDEDEMEEDPLDEEVVLSSEKEGKNAQDGPAKAKRQLKRPHPKTNELVISDDD